MKKKIIIFGILVSLLALTVLSLCLIGRTVNGSEQVLEGVVTDRAMGKVREEDFRGRAYISLEFEDGTAQLFWFSRALQRRDASGASPGDTVRIETAIEAATGLRVVTGIVVLK